MYQRKRSNEDADICDYCFFHPGTSSQLLCYHCDDCNTGTVVVQPCGFDNPMITGPSAPAGTWPETPIITPPSVGGTTVVPDFPIGNPILTPPPNLPGGTVDAVPANPWEPILTPPNHPGTDNPFSTSAPNSGGLITPPVTSSGRMDEVNLPWNNQFVCLTVETIGMKHCSKTQRLLLNIYFSSTVNNRQVIQRGCARQEISNEATCSGATGMNNQRCIVCSTNLCNWES